MVFELDGNFPYSVCGMCTIGSYGLDKGWHWFPALTASNAITLTSQWTRRRVKSPVSLLFAQPLTGEIPAQMASNAENVSIWWRHHAVRKGEAAWPSNVTDHHVHVFLLYAPLISCLNSHDDVIKWNFSALLALCAGTSPVTGEFPSQRPGPLWNNAYRTQQKYQ